MLPRPDWPVNRLRSQGLYRYQQGITSVEMGRGEIQGIGPAIILGSYSYLGLNGHSQINTAAVEAVLEYGTGTHGVRLLAGNLMVHDELEKELACSLKTPAAVVFSSGYSANTAIIKALCSDNCVIFADRLSHASLQEACFNSPAQLFRYRHRDNDHLRMLMRRNQQGRRTVVVTDSVFSMDGDVILLEELLEVCTEASATILIDESHSFGVLGENGGGVFEHYELVPPHNCVITGSLGKAIPSMGGFVAGSQELAEHLRHRSSEYIYSSALGPAQSAAAVAAIRMFRNGTALLERLRENTSILFAAVRNEGLTTTASGVSPIVPIIIGEAEQAWRVAAKCQDQGVFVQCIPPPVVPSGSARLRCAAMATHVPDDLRYAVGVIRETLDEDHRRGARM